MTVDLGDLALAGLSDLAAWDPDRLAGLWAERTALVDVDRRACYTYIDLRDRALAAAIWLSRRGVREGDRVAVLSQNGVHLVDLLFACSRLGAILVPWNWRLTARELSELVEDTKPRLLLASDEFSELAQGVFPEAGLVTLDETVIPWLSPPAGSSALPERAGRASDPWLILYTGGTTGTPKGAVLTRGSITWNSINTAVSWGLGREDSGAVFTPSFHTGFWNVFTLPLLLVGGRVLLPRRFDPEQALRLLVQERLSVCFMVPTMFQLVGELPDFGGADLSSLRWAISGGAPLPDLVYARWKAKVPVFKQGYGLTEVGPNNFATPDEAVAAKPGSVGRLTYFAHARIVDDDGRDLPDDEPGELLLAGPHMCAGYWGRPKATADAIRDGWFHTGDIARRDREGYYYIVDRKKDMLITGGENVYPTEVEGVLYAHRAVRECAVVGTPDAAWGEAVTAVVSFVEGSSATTDELVTHARAGLARYKVPKRFVVVEDLPKTGANKISRAEARKLALRALGENG
jgi:fatty-acyl-CoA synthase